jgi:hypothetical protein
MSSHLGKVTVVFLAFIIAVLATWLGAYLHGLLALWLIENRLLGLPPIIARSFDSVVAWGSAGLITGLLAAVIVKNATLLFSAFIIIGVVVNLAVKSFYMLDWPWLRIDLLKVAITFFAIPLFVFSISLLTTVSLVKNFAEKLHTQN